MGISVNALHCLKHVTTRLGHGQEDLFAYSYAQEIRLEFRPIDTIAGSPVCIRADLPPQRPDAGSYAAL